MTALPAAIAARAVKVAVAVAAETGVAAAVKVAAAAVTGAVAATTVVRAVKVAAAVVRELKALENLGVNPGVIVARGASATAEATRDLRPSSRLHS